MHPQPELLQVSRQIEQMVMFIKQEAEEKANEIRMSAEEVRPFTLTSGLRVQGPVRSLLAHTSRAACRSSTWKN